MGLRQVVLTGGLALCLSLPVAAGLPPEHEAQRLLLATETAVEEGRWDDATDYMNRLQRTDVELEADFYYLRGRIMQEAGQSREARNAYERYVSEAGRDGDMYQEALRRITQMEEAGVAAARALDEDRAEASIEAAGGSELEQLQGLYLADNPVDALIGHINGLLTQHSWKGPSRVIVRHEDQGVHYRISVEGGSLHVRTREVGADGLASASMRRMNVFGINPRVSSDCSSREGACWVLDPRDNSRWLKLAEDRDGAREIARMMSLLLREIQRGR